MSLFKGVLPNAVRIRVVRRGRKATFSYEEDFPRSLAAMVKRTVDGIRIPLRKAGMRISIRGRTTIRMVGTVPYHQVAAMIVGEFFCWTKGGEMTVRDLIGTFVMAQGTA